MRSSKQLRSSFRKNRWLGFALSATLALICLFLAADLTTAHAQEAVFRGKIDLQSIIVRVTDKKGRNVRGLTIANFTLLEDGRPEKIAFFAAEHQPVSLAILVDSSSSMSPLNKSMRIDTLLAPPSNTAALKMRFCFYRLRTGSVHFKNLPLQIV